MTKLMLIVGMLLATVAAAAENSTAAQYAARYAKAHGLRLMWSPDKDYALSEVPTGYTNADLSRVLFLASKLESKLDRPGRNVNDRLLAAAVCQKTVLHVDSLTHIRKDVAAGCEPILNVSTAADEQPIDPQMPSIAFRLVLDGPRWPHGEYTHRIDGKLFGPPSALVLIHGGKHTSVRFDYVESPMWIDFTPIKNKDGNLAISVAITDCDKGAETLTAAQQQRAIHSDGPFVLGSPVNIAYGDGVVRIVPMGTALPGEELNFRD